MTITLTTDNFGASAPSSSELADRLNHVGWPMAELLGLELVNLFGIDTCVRTEGRRQPFFGSGIGRVTVEYRGLRQSGRSGGHSRNGSPGTAAMGWQVARQRLVDYLQQGNTITLTTSSIQTQGNAMIGMETEPGRYWSNIYANPFTWYLCERNAFAHSLRASSSRAAATVGPAMMLLHELGHTNRGCMFRQAGACFVASNSAAAFGTNNPEFHITQDVDQAMVGHRGVFERVWYPDADHPGSRPGAQYFLGRGGQSIHPGTTAAASHEWVQWPSEQQLRTGLR